MKPYIRVLTTLPLPAGGKAAIIAEFAPSRVRIGDKNKEYDDPKGTEVVEYELPEVEECCGEPDKCEKDCDKKEPTPTQETDVTNQSKSEQCGTNKHGQSLELVKQFQEKFGKLPHHKAGDASIIEALKGEAE